MLNTNSAWPNRILFVSFGMSASLGQYTHLRLTFSFRSCDLIGMGSLLIVNRLIHRNASEPNGGSYILTEMIPAYRSASQEHG